MFNFFKNNTVNFINVGRLTDQKDQMTILAALNFIKNKILNPKIKLLIILRLYKQKYKIIK